MKCRKVKKNLVLFLDGELSSPEAEGVRNHLESCEACREEAQLLASTLDVALQRTREKAAPAPPENFCSLFWERVRERGAGARRFPAKHSFSWRFAIRGGRYALASALTMVAIGIAIFAVVQGDKRPSPGDMARSPTEAKVEQVVSLANDTLARIEGQLQELETATRRLRRVTDTSARFSGGEMQEIFAATRLAAAKNYRDVLEMPDEAARRYAQVALQFPETSAGREAEEILSRLN